MALTPQLFTLHALSVELAIDQRRLGRVLARVPPDDAKRKRWRLQTVLAAIACYEGRGGAGSAANAALNQAAVEANTLSAKIDDMMAELSREPDLRKRRAASPPVAQAIEEWAKTLEAATPPLDRPFTQPYRDQLAAAALQALARACEWRIES